MDIACDLCEAGEAAVLMQTNLDTGQVVSVGLQCMPTFMLAATAEITKGMPAKLAGTYDNLFDQIAANDPRGPKPPPAPRQRKAKADQPPPEPVKCPECGSTNTGALDATSKVCGECGHNWEV